MNEGSCSSLAITERRPQRSGGCIGIFKQLFDWNRRLAKKKLFSKKLLPPARAQRVSQKFGGDERLPMAKLLLIADENRGGFPKKFELDSVESSAIVTRTHEMKSPGLVARLMGLESMPAVRRTKPKTASFNEHQHHPCHEKKSESNDRNEVFGCDQEDFQFEKGHTKQDSRPQKLQKTGMFERRAVTRFGAEALQFRNVLSRSRKHQPKLGSPLKSPRSGRNSTRLMEVATKILEPGLHGGQRARSALTYAPSIGVLHRDEEIREERPYMTFDQSEPTSYCVSASKSVKGQPSCKSCGNWFDVVDSKLVVEDDTRGLASSPLDLGVIRPPGPGRSKLRSNVSSLEHERVVPAPIRQERFVSFGAETKAHIERRNKKFTERKPQFRGSQEQYRLPSQRMKSHKEIAPVTAHKQRTPRQSHVPLAKDRGTPSQSFGNLNCQRDLFNVGSVSGTRDYLPPNRNLTSKTRARIPSKVLDNCKTDIERNGWDKRDGSPSRQRASTRKRRPTNGAAQVENTKLNQPHARKQRDERSDAIIGKVVGSSAYPKNQNRIKTELAKQKLPKDTKGDTTGGRNGVDVISFTFSSPMKQNAEPSSPVIEKTGDQGVIKSTGVSMNKKPTSYSNGGKPSSHIATHLTGDALGALLEEKLRELNCQDRDESETGDLRTASILEELISALTAERLSVKKVEDGCSVGFSQEDGLCPASQDPVVNIPLHSPMLNANEKLQEEAQAPGVLVGYSHAGDGEQPSPGCVLDASFSNDSCFSGSLDDCLGYKPQAESTECSYEEEELSEFDADLSDSATSLSTGRAHIDKVKYSLNNISSVLYGIDPADMGLVGSDLNHAWEVIASAELLIGSACGIHSLVNFSIGSLLDKLEDISDAVLSSPKCSMGFTKATSGSQLRRFLFDCVIEFLESKYGDYCRSRFITWPKLPFPINGELLTKEVHEEVQKWADLAGKTADEIVEKEMSHSFGKWTCFEVEMFESGVEIERDILQALVEEVVIDFRQSRSIFGY